MSAKLSQFIEYRDIEMIDLDDIHDMECQSYDFPWNTEYFERLCYE